VVVGVEVAVGGVSRVAGLRRPHPVADLQIAAEGHHIGVTHGPAEGGITVQRRTVDHEMTHTGCGVTVLHSRGVGALGRPDALRGVREALPGVGETLAQRELAQPRIEQRLERV
jgi:hypothetical protein